MEARRIPGPLQKTGVPAAASQERSSLLAKGLFRELQLHVPAFPRANFHALG